MTTTKVCVKVGPHGHAFDPWQLVADLYDAGTDYEVEALQEMLIKSGWAWKCEAKTAGREHCGAVVDYDSDECQDCNAPRPENPDASRN